MWSNFFINGYSFNVLVLLELKLQTNGINCLGLSPSSSIYHTKDFKSLIVRVVFLEPSIWALILTVAVSSYIA